MKDENILNINVANGISILIMAAVGALLLQAARKFVLGKGAATLQAGARAPGT